MFDTFGNQITLAKQEAEAMRKLAQECYSKTINETVTPKDFGAVPDNPFDTQVGGNHYKGMAIQPLEFSYKNNLNVFQSNVVKYTCRAPLKGDTEKDIRKAIHYLEMWLKTLEKPF